MRENQVSLEIVRAALEVHKALGGPGLLESIYEEALVFELELRSLKVARQANVPLVYKGQQLQNTLRPDLIVANCVVVECKSTSKYHEVFNAQALTYLRLTGLRLALVINFGETLLKSGVHRVVNGLYEE